jgi:hypothetical protein
MDFPVISAYADWSKRRAAWMRAIAVGLVVGAPGWARGEDGALAEKLDPGLLALVETAGPEERERSVDVLVALSRPADAELVDALSKLGLRTRSTIGTILTGSIDVGNVSRLAESPDIIKLESSTPMYRE